MWQNIARGGIAYHSSDFWHLKRQGKSIVMFALENGYGIGTDLLNVERLYNLGVRAITLPTIITMMSQTPHVTLLPSGTGSLHSDIR